MRENFAVNPRLPLIERLNKHIGDSNHYRTSGLTRKENMEPKQGFSMASILRLVRTNLRNSALRIRESLRKYNLDISLSPPQRLFLKWFCIACLLFIISLLLIDSVRDSHSDEAEAYSVAQDFVSERLVRPSSAQFPPKSASGIEVKYLGENRYLISGYLDSLNTFGNSQRSNYTCVVRYIGAGEWADERVSFK